MRSAVQRGAPVLLLAVLAGPQAEVSSGGQVLLAQDTVRPPHACPEELIGVWRGALPVRDLFRVDLSVVESAAGELTAEIATHGSSETVAAWLEGPYLRFQSAVTPLSFRGAVPESSESLHGFVQDESTLVHVVLDPVPAVDGRRWTIDWSPLEAEQDELPFDLYIDEDGEGGIGGYFFFRDQRLPGLWGYGLECVGDEIRVGERVLGLRFDGSVDAEANRLDMSVRRHGGPATPMSFDRLPGDRVPDTPDAPDVPPRPSAGESWTEIAPDRIADGWPTATPSSVGMSADIIRDFVRAVAAGELEYTHSVLVARRGRLVVEEYFYGFDRETRHDMRSASKSVTSTLTGLAVQDDRLAGPHARVLPLLPRYRWYDNWDDRKRDITIHHLLTMSSGLDARDWEPGSVASEGAYQTQAEQPDWVKYALDAPMLWDPGEHVYYGGANPLILGGILSSVLDEPVEWFAHRTLFGPLGINDYSFFLDPTGVPYMGGGMYMRPRDMLKYGQLYLDGGTWQGRRILSRDWVEESFGKYGRLEPIERNGQLYGYLWWHHRYEIGDAVIESVEARGNGGQYVFVVPDLDLVAVITSGNFRNGRLRQPEEILRNWILPSALEGNGH